jgi:CheY-like chemotaxis protein
MVDGEYTDDDKYILKMTVKDTGRGISVEGQRNLFDAFQRADLRQNGTIEGTGLGLAIVKSIIDSMKGEISVNSKLGEGSEFTVKLPIGIYDKTPVEEENLKHAPKVKKDVSKIDFKAPNAKILTVDDNNSNLRIVTLFLKRAGIVPDSCDSGVKALELCKQNQYDIILLDHMMPGMDGIETLERIKNDDDSKNKETTVIVLTANAIAGSRKRYMDAGFADYLTKPLDATILEQTIKKYLPADKVVMLDGSNNTSVSNTSYDTSSDSKKLASIKDRLTSIDGLDYDEAMKYAGYDEEILEEIVGNIARESEDKIKLMEKAFEEGNMKDFGCEAHSIKGLMAMIGLKAFSERALKLEAKANEGDMEYVQNETKDFINSYRDICNKLVGK